jgi:pyrimidine-specific ribonucleoside hydrolase
VLLLLSADLGAHTYRVSVLVDTDMALDDIRALCMLLNSHMVDIPLISCSDGAVAPQVGCRNVLRLLACFDREDIPVAAGRELGKPPPSWRSWCENLKWPGSARSPGRSKPDLPAAEAIVNALKTGDRPLIYLCLGPMTNLADAIRLDPSIKEKISRVLCYGAPSDTGTGTWNYTRDPASADAVCASGLTIYCVDIPQEKQLSFAREILPGIEDMDTPAAHLVAALHESPAVKSLLAEGHSMVWDEMTVIYLHHPSLFTVAPAEQRAELMSLADFRVDAVKRTYAKLLGYNADFHLTTRPTVVLNAFPADPSFFQEDIKPVVEDIIEKYGLEEWKACLLTNEFHRHLGIYSIIGAKMGIRARELLEAPFDTLQVYSMAGDQPPLSCLNDGLQVATGASLGRGAIQVSSGPAQPAATFVHKGRKLTLKVDEVVLDRVRADIRAALDRYGGLNPEYFAHIRKLSIGYWYHLDRRTIFAEVAE